MHDTTTSTERLDRASAALRIQRVLDAGAVASTLEDVAAQASALLAWSPDSSDALAVLALVAALAERLVEATTDDVMISPSTAAALIDEEPDTIRRWARAKRIRYTQNVSGRYRVSRADVLARAYASKGGEANDAA